jgi:hypothetical protein
MFNDLVKRALTSAEIPSIREPNGYYREDNERPNLFYGIPQSLFKNLKILDLENTLVVEIQKGILLYSCHIVRKFLNIDTEHKTQKSQNVEARRR